MAWFRRPLRDYNDRRKPFHQQIVRPRRSSCTRIISWSFCIFLTLLIAFWPKNPAKHVRPALISKRSPRFPAYAESEQSPLKNSKVQHIYRHDGLLDVNPNARHPILDLIERSELQWNRKVDRQSRTLSQAVQEYKRRYGRLPPKGFDLWWKFVDSNNVQLVDEYDSINDHIKPFWGIDPLSLRALQAEWETHEDTFTIGKIEGADIALLSDTMNGSLAGNERALDQIAILTDIQQWLPDFRATFTIHDGPAHFVSWGMRQRATHAAHLGEYIDVKRVAEFVHAGGWAAACPPNTPIHTYSADPMSTTRSGKKSFIHNHRLTMDPCLHPSHLTLSGYLSQYNGGPEPRKELIPTFSACATSLHSDILTVAPEQFQDDVGPDPSWEDKSDNRLLWRGSNTGIWYTEGMPWNVSQRIRLVEMGTRRGGTVRVLPSHDVEDAPVGHGDLFNTNFINSAFMDVAFIGGPIQCDHGFCEQLRGMFEWRPFQSWRDAWEYKYIMDVDGNGWSARFKRLMTSNSLIFKATIFPEWYTERIMPWVHYIPIQIDFSDLYDTLMFFRGDLSGKGAHETLAQKIATAGKEWSKKFYRRVDMTAYHFRLFLEYARVMSHDRESMYFDDHEGF